MAIIGTVKIRLTIAALAILTLRAFAQEEAKPSSISFSVKEQATRQTITNHHSYYDYSYSRDVLRKKTVEIEVRNMGRGPAKDVAVSIYWVGVRNSTREPFIYGDDEKSVTVEAGRSQKVTAESPALSEHQLHDVYFGEDVKGGSLAKGYVVEAKYKDVSLPAYFSAGVANLGGGNKFEDLKKKRTSK